MGLDRYGVEFLIACSAGGVRFDRTAMIGRQFLYVHPEDLARSFERFARPLPPDSLHRISTNEDGYAEPLLQELGATLVESIDASDYEGSSIRHDMNQPVPDALQRRFSTVIDGGSLEHVFNFPVAIRNCMDMTEPGGHFLAVTPANDQLGHGFFQFSPELYFRVLSPQNGFVVEHMFIHELSPGTGWYEVRDPQALGYRVTVRTKHPTYLYVRAKRVEAVPLLAEMPQQSDYTATWSTGGTQSSQLGVGPSPPASRTLRRLLPARLRHTLSRLRTAPPRRFRSPAFTRVRLDEAADLAQDHDEAP